MHDSIGDSTIDMTIKYRLMIRYSPIEIMLRIRELKHINIKADSSPKKVQYFRQSIRIWGILLCSPYEYSFETSLVVARLIPELESV